MRANTKGINVRGLNLTLNSRQTRILPVETGGKTSHQLSFRIRGVQSPVADHGERGRGAE